MKLSRRIPFNSLLPAYDLIAAEIETAVTRVLRSGSYILGSELESFEASFASYLGVKHAIGVASGTDAIELALRAADVGTGDEVITVSHTAVPTVCAVERAGATPVLVDIDPTTYTIDPRQVEAAITTRTAAILPFHLYGRPADMTALESIAKQHGLLLVEDCAQAHGARHRGRMVGSIGDLGAFSFYPTKNLGAFGDAGAVVTDDDEQAERLRRLRNYGQAKRYQHVEPGINSRLDELQAAILSVKLNHLDANNAIRQQIAAAYLETIEGVQLPKVDARDGHVFHLFVVQHALRDRIRDWLDDRGVETAVHYPTPVHLQEAYRHLGRPEGSLPLTELCARQVFSLPMYVGLATEDVRRIGRLVSAAAKETDQT
jgi:dTDP-3-amino-3,4,6-trideoxy-alpha-D-glucose transaminase